jgi:hypothetical protein
MDDFLKKLLLIKVYPKCHLSLSHTHARARTHTHTHTHTLSLSLSLPLYGKSAESQNCEASRDSRCYGTAP